MHLALVAAGGPEFWHRVITTEELNERDERSYRLQKVAEVACLRVEDIKLSGMTLACTEAFVWLRKEFQYKGLNKIVHLYAGNQQIDTFDGHEDTCTLITLKITNKKHLDSEEIEVISETTEL